MLVDIETLEKLIKEGQPLSDVIIIIGFHDPQLKQFNRLVKTLETLVDAKGLTVVLESDFTGAHLQACCDFIRSGRCPPHLTIGLKGSPMFSPRAADKVASAITSPHCPQHLSFFLENCQLVHGSMRGIMQALSSGRCPSDLTVSFGLSWFDVAREWRDITTALKSPQLAKNLTLGLTAERLGQFAEDIEDVLLDLIHHRQLPAGLMVEGLCLEVSQRLSDYHDAQEAGHVRTFFAERHLLLSEFMTITDGYIIGAGRHIAKEGSDSDESEERMDVSPS